MFSNLADRFCWMPLESHIYILLDFEYSSVLQHGLKALLRQIHADLAEFEESLSQQGGVGVAVVRVGCEDLLYNLHIIKGDSYANAEMG